MITTETSMRVWVALSLMMLLTSSPEARADWQEIQRRGVLRVVTDIDPSTAFENEVMESFVELHGLKLQMLQNRPFAERIPLVLSGEADLAMSLFDTPERRELVDFSVEVLPSVYTMATCGPQPPIADVEELRTRRVGMMAGSIMEQTARRLGVPDANIAGYPDVRAVIEALCGGQLTAALIAMPDIASFRHLFPGLRYGAPMGEVTSAAWAIRKGSPELRAKVDEYLTNIRRSGAWSRLLVKHFGAEALAVLGRAGVK